MSLIPKVYLALLLGPIAVPWTFEGVEMPKLNEITYSETETVECIRDYYDFLMDMYMEEDIVDEPPDGRWPKAELLHYLGKTDAILSLLARLPYIMSRNRPEVAPFVKLSDFSDFIRVLELHQSAAEIVVKQLHSMTEVEASHELTPPYVISLTDSKSIDGQFLIDVELGVVTWTVCPLKDQFEELKEVCEPVLDDPYDYAPDEEEAEWRGTGTSWAIRDFFEMLKDQFRLLKFIPVGPLIVRDIRDWCGDHSTWGTAQLREFEIVSLVQKIYVDHGWPDLQRYRKTECMEAIRTMIVDKFPEKMPEYYNEE